MVGCPDISAPSSPEGRVTIAVILSSPIEADFLIRTIGGRRLKSHALVIFTLLRCDIHRTCQTLRCWRAEFTLVTYLHPVYARGLDFLSLQRRTGKCIHEGATVMPPSPVTIINGLHIYLTFYSMRWNDNNICFSGHVLVIRNVVREFSSEAGMRLYKECHVLVQRAVRLF